MTAIWLVLQALGSRLFGVLKTPLGQHLLAAGLALLAAWALYAAGQHAGRAAEQHAQALREAAAKVVVVRREATADRISTRVGADLAQAKVEIRYRTRTLVKEVPTYVTPADDARCIVNAGFVRTYNRAVDPGLPEVPGGSQSAPSGVALSTVLDTDLANIGVAQEALAEARAWREWYVAQSAAWSHR